MAQRRKSSILPAGGADLSARLGPGGGVILAVILLFSLAILTMFAVSRAGEHHGRLHADTGGETVRLHLPYLAAAS